MNEEIRVELLRLVDGGRLLRLEHPPSGLSLEKRLDAALPVVTQTTRWRQVFASLLARELVTAASGIVPSDVDGETAHREYLEAKHSR